MGSVDLWGYKPTGMQNTDVHLCLPFQLRFCFIDSSCKWSLKGPHFAVARGFSSVSLQKSFTVPKALFSCLGLGVSEAPFFFFLLPAVREAVTFIASWRNLTAAVVKTRSAYPSFSTRHLFLHTSALQACFSCYILCNNNEEQSVCGGSSSYCMFPDPLGSLVSHPALWHRTCTRCVEIALMHVKQFAACAIWKKGKCCFCFQLTHLALLVVKHVPFAFYLFLSFFGQWKKSQCLWYL